MHLLKVFDTSTNPFITIRRLSMAAISVLICLICTINVSFYFFVLLVEGCIVEKNA